MNLTTRINTGLVSRIEAALQRDYSVDTSVMALAMARPENLFTSVILVDIESEYVVWLVRDTTTQTYFTGGHYFKKTEPQRAFAKFAEMSKKAYTHDANSMIETPKSLRSPQQYCGHCEALVTVEHDQDTERCPECKHMIL